MIRVSVGSNNDNVHFKSREFNSFDKLKSVILKLPYSFGIYDKNYRNIKNFKKAYCVGLDFDEGVTLKQAKEMFKAYQYIISTTRNHQKEKNGKPACDRFRVILFLEKPVVGAEAYYAVWYQLYNKFPQIDKACKDPSRYFYPSVKIYADQKKGMKVKLEPVALVKKKPKPEEIDDSDHSSTKSEVKLGELSKRTLKFFNFGASKGYRHHELYAASRDAHQQGYSEEWFLQQIQRLVNNTGDDSFLDDGAKQAIADAFAKDPKHDKRLKPKSGFHLQPIGECYEDKSEIEWNVDKLLHKGGMSILSADPKAGKSTLARQLMTCVVKGIPFLKRKCEKGPVIYLAIEEQIQVINQCFRALDVSEDDPLYVHVGDIVSNHMMSEFEELIEFYKPKLVVIDTLFDFLDVESENSYKEMKRELRILRELARRTGSHIMFIHHNSKPQQHDGRRGNKAILGSTAIAGAMDTIMILEVDGKERLLTAQGRAIDGFYYRELHFDLKTFRYKMGVEKDKEDFK